MGLFSCCLALILANASGSAVPLPDELCKRAFQHSVSLIRHQTPCIKRRERSILFPLFSVKRASLFSIGCLALALFTLDKNRTIFYTIFKYIMLLYTRNETSLSYQVTERTERS